MESRGRLRSLAGGIEDLIRDLPFEWEKVLKPSRPWYDPPNESACSLYEKSTGLHPLSPTPPKGS